MITFVRGYHTPDQRSADDGKRTRTVSSGVFNQIAGGKSPACSLDELSQRGVSIVLYSTPCLFAAQRAIQDEMETLKERGGRLDPPSADGVGLAECNELLQQNLDRRQEAASLCFA